MVAQIRKCCLVAVPPGPVVAVVGMGHVAGMVACWEDAIDEVELVKIPKKRRDPLLQVGHTPRIRSLCALAALSYTRSSTYRAFAW